MKTITVYLIVIISLLGAFTGCEVNVTEYLKKTDTIKICFYAKSENKIDKKYLEIEIKEKTKMNEIISYISTTSTPFYKCGYSGSIQFYWNDALLLNDKAEFNLHPDCNHIVFMYRDKHMSRKLTDKGIQYLNSLYNQIPAKMRL